jgi:hypothetical protein
MRAWHRNGCLLALFLYVMLALPGVLSDRRADGLGNPAVTAVIPGTDKAAHMADNLGAGRGRLPNAAQRQRMVQFIEALA